MQNEITQRTVRGRKGKGAKRMQCGAKCFLVEIEKQNGEYLTVDIQARSPILARKTARLQLEKDDRIVKVRPKFK